MVKVRPDAAEVQAILDRLDQLEKDNQALLEEVRALRQEVSGLHAPEPGTAPSQTADERQAVEENRIDELAQTKVEASQKFPIRITGMALFNASVNGRFNGNMENPLVASPTPGEMTGDGTLRQSTLGLLFNGPQTFWNAKISGSIYMDFFGGSTSSLDHLVRLRTAAINIDWKNTSVMFGQDKPLISPRDPDSLAQVGYSPLTGAGNLWLWQPQARVEQRFSLGENSGLRAQAGVIVTSSLDYPANSPIPLSIPAIPGLRRSRNTPGRAPKRAWSCGIVGATPAASSLRAAITSIKTASSKPSFLRRSIRSTGSCGRFRNWSFRECFFTARTSAPWARCRKGSSCEPIMAK